jgi:hypothetical protein
MMKTMYSWSTALPSPFRVRRPSGDSQGGNELHRVNEAQISMKDH